MDDYTNAGEEVKRLRLRLDEEGGAGARIACGVFQPAAG